MKKTKTKEEINRLRITQPRSNVDIESSLYLEDLQMQLAKSDLYVEFKFPLPHNPLVGCRNLFSILCILATACWSLLEDFRRWCRWRAFLGRQIPTHFYRWF